MPENVETGGLMKFSYKQGEKQELSEQRKREIKEAYLKAGIRKDKEKRDKVVWWIIGIIIFILVIGFFIYVNK